MRRILLPVFSLFFLLLVGCNKSVIDEETSLSIFFECTIDGDAFFTDENVVVSYGADLILEGSFYSISGKDTDGNGFTIWMEGPITEGTFTTTNLSSSIQTTIIYDLVGTVYQTWSSAAEGGSGMITIDKNHSDYLEGHFNFTGVNDADESIKNFTSGSFKALKL